MKKNLIFIIIIISTYNIANCQVESEANKIYKGAYVSMNISTRLLEKHPVIYSGGSGAIILKDFRLGIFFSGLRKNTYYNSNTSPLKRKLACSQIGVLFAYPFFKSKKLHGIIETKFNYGTSKLIDTNMQSYDINNFVGLNGLIGVEYTFNEYFSLSIGLDYQHAFFIKTPKEYSKNDFNSPGICIDFKIGSF